MFILKKGHQPGVYVPLRALFLVSFLLVALYTLAPFAQAVKHPLRDREAVGSIPSCAIPKGLKRYQ